MRRVSPTLTNFRSLWTPNEQRIIEKRFLVIPSRLLGKSQAGSGEWQKPSALKIFSGSADILFESSTPRLQSGSPPNRESSRQSNHNRQGSARAHESCCSYTRTQSARAPISVCFGLHCAFLRGLDNPYRMDATPENRVHGLPFQRK